MEIVKGKNKSEMNGNLVHCFNNKNNNNNMKKENFAIMGCIRHVKHGLKYF